jgi:3-hydroxybutyryl-CoA dehydratase
MDALRPPETLIVDDATPSRIIKIGHLVVGDRVEQPFSFSAEHRKYFAQVANDRAPVHEDQRFAHAMDFSGTIIQGLCVVTRFSRLIGMYLPGGYAILESINFKFLTPTYGGQPLLFRVEVNRLLTSMKVVRLTLSAFSETSLHISGEAQCLIK